MKKGEVLKSITTNFTIACMLVALGVLSFSGGITAVFAPSSENVFYKGDAQKNKVSIMINVYWGNEYLPSMLSTLKENKVHSTFFVGGMWVSKYPEDFMSIWDAGHEIGNHGYFHKDGDKLDYNQNKAEIENTHKLVKEYTGADMHLFAPPSGAIGTQTIKAAENLGYKVIMWSKDSIDWRDQDEELIFSRVTKNLSGGDFILMHPTLSTSKVLDRIIKFIQNSGFEIVPVSQCL